ncbi:uncharacterized protein V1516DRAFT_679331 [Lipomyces oligophaga]|uniref:uncharacterized protein n=1 Tax=Lipomyces oligophaga TaxID=45792 RepID=UPI0034CEC91E
MEAKIVSASLTEGVGLESSDSASLVSPAIASYPPPASLRILAPSVSPSPSPPSPHSSGIRIMRRETPTNTDTSNDDLTESEAVEALVACSESNTDITSINLARPITLEERAAMYAEARRRIFDGVEETPLDDEAVEAENLESVAASLASDLSESDSTISSSAPGGRNISKSNGDDADFVIRSQYEYVVIGRSKVYQVPDANSQTKAGIYQGLQPVVHQGIKPASQPNHISTYSQNQRNQNFYRPPASGQYRQYPLVSNMQNYGAYNQISGAVPQSANGPYGNLYGPNNYYNYNGYGGHLLMQMVPKTNTSMGNPGGLGGWQGMGQPPPPSPSLGQQQFYGYGPMPQIARQQAHIQSSNRVFGYPQFYGIGPGLHQSQTGGYSGAITDNVTHHQDRNYGPTRSSQVPRNAKHHNNTISTHGQQASSYQFPGTQYTPANQAVSHNQSSLDRSSNASQVAPLRSYLSPQTEGISEKLTKEVENLQIAANEELGTSAAREEK